METTCFGLGLSFCRHVGDTNKKQLSLYVIIQHQMTLSKIQFFIIFFLLIVLPFTLYKLVWLASARSTTGIVSFTGHGNLGAALGITTYPVVKFYAGRDTIYFNGNADLRIMEGEAVAVYYQEND